MELCFHRDQTLCVSRKIFLGLAVQLVEGLSSLIGEQIVTGFLSSQNGLCLFLSHSFLFFPVTYFLFHCRLITRICSSSLLLHFPYHCSRCTRISYHRGVGREWGGTQPSLKWYCILKIKSSGHFAPQSYGACWVTSWAALVTANRITEPSPGLQLRPCRCQLFMALAYILSHVLWPCNKDTHM